MSEHRHAERERIQVYPWAMAVASVGNELGRGLYSCPAECCICGELAFSLLVVMSRGIGKGAGVSPMCFSCLHQIPAGEAVDTDPRFMKLRDDGMTASYVSDPKQWKTRR